MNVTLIPFLLAANLAVQDVNEQGNYLEYTFLQKSGIYVNSTDNLTANSIIVDEKASLRIKCRPKDNITITCRLHEMLTHSSDREGEFRLPLDGGIDAPFDIIFNQNGVESFVTITTQHSTWKNLCKQFIDTLNIGADLRNITSLPAEFESVEYSIIGPVNTTYNINLVPATDLPFTIPDRQQNFTLNFLPIPEGNPGYYMVIEKDRDFFYAGSLLQEVLANMNIDDMRIDVAPSTSKLYIGGATGFFESMSTSTVEEIDRYGNTKRRTSLKITMSVVLEKIEWTNEKWPTVVSKTQINTMLIENSVLDIIGI